MNAYFLEQFLHGIPSLGSQPNDLNRYQQVSNHATPSRRTLLCTKQISEASRLKTIAGGKHSDWCSLVNPSKSHCAAYNYTKIKHINDARYLQVDELWISLEGGLGRKFQSQASYSTFGLVKVKQSMEVTPSNSEVMHPLPYFATPSTTQVSISSFQFAYTRKYAPFNSRSQERGYSIY